MRTIRETKETARATQKTAWF